MKIKWGKWKHYKGGEYEVLGVGIHSENLEEMVIYKSLKDNHGYQKGTIWIRPIKEWNEKIDFEGKKIKRFVLIKG